MTSSGFWNGFMKRAEFLDFPELAEQAKDDERVNQPPPLLAKTISKAGPVLSDITLASDRERFEQVRG